MQRVSVVSVAAVVVAAVVCGGGAGAAHRFPRQLFPGDNSPECPGGELCIPVRSCPAAIKILENRSPQGFQMLREKHCGFDGNRNPLTCCPDTEPTIVLPTEPLVTSPRPTARPTTQPTTQSTTQSTTQPTTQPTAPPTQSPFNPGDLLPAKCGSSDAGQTRIFFGENSPLGAYPWIALLGYTSRFQPQVVWGCGGSLINSRYIVTAGHCTAPEFTFNRDLTMIRLGEHDLSTEIDCETRGGRRTCAPPHQTFTPVEVTRHESFNSRGTVSDDVALIRLDKEVEFNAFVSPICLPPTSVDISELLGGRQAFVAGWGATERGPDTQILQQVRIPFVTRDDCNPHYNNALLPEQVCFGGDGQRDSCFGDSGGPVVSSTSGGKDFILLGIVSFGQPSCGVVGVPAVYTSVPSYRQWIIDNLKP